MISKSTKTAQGGDTLQLYLALQNSTYAIALPTARLHRNSH